MSQEFLFAVGNSQAWNFSTVLIFLAGNFWSREFLGFVESSWDFLGFGFLSPFDHPGCLEYTPLGLYQTLYVVFHLIVEKLESIWKSLIVLYFFNLLLCVWIFNNNVASHVCYNNMKLVLKFSFSSQCFVAFLYQWRHCFWNIMPHPPLQSKAFHWNVSFFHF